MDVKFDYINLSSKVIIPIMDTTNSLNQTINKCLALNIPEDFQYIGFLKNLGSDLSSIKSSLSNIKEYLNQSNNKYDILINDLNIKVSRISNIMIDREESKII